MKKLALTLISITALASAFAFAQDHGHGDAHAQKIHEVMMKGLTDEEKQTAHNIHALMSEDARKVFQKRVNLCMKDSHKSLEGKKMDHKLEMEHFMSGLTKEEQKTLMDEVHQMKKEETLVLKKIVRNCCEAGKKHAKAKQ
jgi:DNA replication initiation complex subunit (GINS family)